MIHPALGIRLCACAVQPRCLLIGLFAVQLILRSINTARSAFVAITFRNEYFDAFDVYETVIVQAGVLIKVRNAATDGTSGIAFPSAVRLTPTAASTW